MIFVKVDAKALLRILNAVNGPEHLIRELQFTRDIDKDNPINILTAEYNNAAREYNEALETISEAENND